MTKYIKEKRGNCMINELISVFISIPAGVIYHLICKWLDKLLEKDQAKKD